jgi:hypothetical protein
MELRMAKHKHYDVIVAWAEGKPIECRLSPQGDWLLVINPNPNWHIDCEYRIKPHKYQEVIDAWNEGKKVQFKTETSGIWRNARGKETAAFLGPLPFDTYPSWEWRIKPPTKKYRLYLYKAMIGYVIGIVEGYQTFNPENMDCFVRWVTDWQEIEIE